MFDERNKIDVTRTFANYAIVLMHAWAAQQYVIAGTWEYRAWDFICNALTAIVLPELFLISGYLMMRNFSPASYSTKLVRRVKRLLVPYVAWNLTFVAFYLCTYRFVPRMCERVRTFGLCSWQGAFDKVVSFMIAPIDMPTWFMRTLMVYAILSLPLWFSLRRWKGILAYCFLAAWFVLTLILGWGGVLKFTYPFYSILCFTLGAHLSLMGVPPYKAFSSRKWLPLAVIGAAGLFWYNICWPIRRGVLFVPICNTCAKLGLRQEILVLPLYRPFPFLQLRSARTRTSVRRMARAWETDISDCAVLHSWSCCQPCCILDWPKVAWQMVWNLGRYTLMP